MPAFDWRLNDDQVAAVISYIRNAWGNSAPSLNAAAIKNARNSLAASP
jgi:mono/diheme cytochrome c family protein